MYINACRSCVVLSAVALAAACPALAPAQAPEPKQQSAYLPFVAPASDEGEQALAQLRLPAGFKASLFAAEPRLANPVAFTIDEQNRFYVVETFRRRTAVIDVRGVMHWLDDDTAARTVGMRNAMVRKFLAPKAVEAMTEDSERLRRVEDRDGDGKADFDSVFAEGFNRLEDGIAAGVLVHGDDVFFADVPSLWRLRDKDNNAVADVRDELHYGYGVRYAFNGHDLHGLRMGPDGKLYFSMGDRGLHVERTPDGRVVSFPDGGAVLRCNPDGTELELFHVGLRNPQELAFDEFGNLFTGDNNSDGGDKARWVYCVEGGDSGWRIGYQAQDFPVSRGPWNHEGLWRDNPPFPRYYILPPVIELKAAGPSGLTRDPGGAGLPPEFAGRFFLADFRGGPANSSVWALNHKPKGAGFEMTEQKPLLGNLLVTDVEIGWDGMYVSDWTDGWVTTGKGRLYRLWHEDGQKAPLVAETRKLMSEGMAKRPPEELAKLLAHADQRVRQAAQFELAGRGDPAAFQRVAADTAPERRLARLHAIWGLGQIARKSPAAMEAVLPLARDGDEEVRAQAIKVLGEAKFAPAHDAVMHAMTDASPRVRFFALLSAGKLGRKEATPKVVEVVRENADKDPYLRHAGVMALTSLGSPSALAEMRKEESPAVRMAALLALRRHQSPEIAGFLDDREPDVVLEAARAINDEPIEPAMPKLAALIGREGLTEPVVARVLNANYRAGTAEGAAGLAKYAAASKDKESFRVQALQMLGAWEQVPGRDRVTGNWKTPPAPRDAKIARDAAGPILPDVLRTAPDAVRVVAAGLVTKLGVNNPALLAELAADAKLRPTVRAAAIAALAESGDAATLGKTVDAAMKDGDERVRAAAVRALGKLPGGVQRIAAVLNTGSTRERQAGLAALAAAPAGDEADRLVVEQLERMTGGASLGNRVPAEVHLDVLETAAARKSPAVAAKLEQYKNSGDPAHPLAAWRETLVGGDAAVGEQIFRERADVSCLRCHSIDRRGGNAGPDLVGLANRMDRTGILESIVTPSKVIAPGFETVTVRLRDGTTHVGQVKQEDEKILHLVDPGGKPDVRIDKTQIRNRRGGMSSMPDNISQTLSKQDMRNLVEFLSTLKDEPGRGGRNRRDRNRPADDHGDAKAGD